MNREASIDQREMDKAFARAQKGEPTLVGLASHDFRNLETEVNFVLQLIEESNRRYHDVTFKYCSGQRRFENR